MMFHLSIVAGSRNDDHGGNLLSRMQHFVDGAIRQCVKHGLSAELILVDWNPPTDRLPLSKALTIPKELGNCQIRFITVPPKLHQKHDHADSLPLFQMIAKNVGIRRARGKYVLATNIDILFSDELIIYLRDKLKSGCVYRADRLDVPATIPQKEQFEKILTYCQKNTFRINGKYGTRVFQNGLWSFVDVTGGASKSFFQRSIGLFWLRKGFLFLDSLRKKRDQKQFDFLRKNLYRRLILNVHTNACGDFTLLAKDDWKDLRGYPEMHGYSWHLDSFLLYQAVLRGKKQVELSNKQVIYHIEHGKSSGYTPEEHHVLFDRLKKERIPSLSDQELLDWIGKMKKAKNQSIPFLYNDMNWGFQNLSLEEEIFDKKTVFL